MSSAAVQKMKASARFGFIFSILLVVLDEGMEVGRGDRI
jgi:hypothetical protein